MAIAGYRVQIHKVGSRVIVYSRNGHDFTELAQLPHELPAKAATIERYLRMRDL